VIGAERLRREGTDVVLLTGSELSLFNRGFLSGDTLEDRLALFATPERLRAAMPHLRERVNAFLAEAAAGVGRRFGGNVSYASLPFEHVDWTPFDIVATDGGYRSAEVAGRFREGIRSSSRRGSRSRSRSSAAPPTAARRARALAEAYRRLG